MPSHPVDPPADKTPGRPKESGSRQQTQPGQASNTGSPAFDKEATKGGKPPAALPKPAREDLIRSRRNEIPNRNSDPLIIVNRGHYVTGQFDAVTWRLGLDYSGLNVYRSGSRLYLPATSGRPPPMELHPGAV